MQTLVVDGALQPHRRVSWQKAVEMVFVGKAEVERLYEEPLRAVSRAMDGFSSQFRRWMDLCADNPNDDVIVLRMPAVIRLVRVITRKKVVKFSRINVMTRDDFRCQYCGERKTMSQLNYDHVIPRSQGGKTEWTNIVTACYDCNAAKGNRTPQQAGMRLRKQPVKPKSLPIAGLRFSPGDAIHDLWRDFIYWNVELEAE